MSQIHVISMFLVRKTRWNCSKRWVQSATIMRKFTSATEKKEGGVYELAAPGYASHTYIHAKT